MEGLRDIVDALPFDLQEPTVGSADWHARRTQVRDTQEIRTMVLAIANAIQAQRPVARMLALLRKRLTDVTEA